MLNPVLRGWGPTSGKATRRPSSARSTATSTSEWPGWPAGNTAVRGPTGRTGSPRTGSTARHLPAHRNGALSDCACLTMNDVGEPCAGEPHARFDRGPLATRNKHCGAAGPRPAAGTRHHMAWSGPQPQQRSAEPAAYLTGGPRHSPRYSDSPAHRAFGATPSGRGRCSRAGNLYVRGETSVLLARSRPGGLSQCDRPMSFTS